MMTELGIDYNVIFRSDCSEDLENFLVSYTDNENSKLHVLDFSGSEQEYCKNKQMLDDFGFKNNYATMRMNWKNTSDFEVFQGLLKFDKDYEYFESNYLVFCFGGQLFEDTLDILISELKENKCLAVSPMSVDFQGNFYEFEEFNPNCFVVNKSATKKILDYCNSFTEFIDAARLKKMSMIMSNGMVFG